VDEFPLFQAVLRWGKAECKRQEKKTDRLVLYVAVHLQCLTRVCRVVLCCCVLHVCSGDDLRAVMADLLPLIRFPTMELENIAAHVATSQMLTQDQLLDLFKFVSIADEKEKSNTTSQFNTKPRSGGFMTKESKILDARKHKKDFLRFFGIGRYLPSLIVHCTVTDLYCR
jgi:hypothetical protein